MFLVELSASTSSVSIFICFIWHTQMVCMYGIFTYIFHKTKPNVDKHAIHSAHLVYVLFDSVAFIFNKAGCSLVQKADTPVENLLACQNKYLYFHGNPKPSVWSAHTQISETNTPEKWIYNIPWFFRGYNCYNPKGCKTHHFFMGFGVQSLED